MLKRIRYNKKASIRSLLIGFFALFICIFSFASVMKAYSDLPTPNALPAHLLTYADHVNRIELYYDGALELATNKPMYELSQDCALDEKVVINSRCVTILPDLYFGQIMETMANGTDSQRVYFSDVSFTYNVPFHVQIQDDSIRAVGFTQIDWKEELPKDPEDPLRGWKVSEDPEDTLYWISYEQPIDLTATVPVSHKFIFDLLNRYEELTLIQKQVIAPYLSANTDEWSLYVTDNQDDLAKAIENAIEAELGVAVVSVLVGPSFITVELAEAIIEVVY